MVKAESVKKILIGGLLFILSLVVGFFYGKRIYFSQISRATRRSLADSANKEAMQIYNGLPIDSNDVVFVGTSMTARFPLNELYGTIRIKNRGIGSNCAYHIEGRIGNIVKAHPRKLFLEFGINDFLLGAGVDSVLHAYKRVITLIRHQSPRTSIYVQSIFPVSGIEENAPIEHMIEEFNPILKGYCDSLQVSYINLFPLFYKKNGLDNSLRVDGIHLNMKGYSIWKSRIDSLVQ